MSEPIRISRSQQEMIQQSMDWLKKNYGDELKSNPDKYHERLGFLIDFVTDIYPDEQTIHTAFEKHKDEIKEIQ